MEAEKRTKKGLNWRCDRAWIKFSCAGNEYTFKTDNGIVYSVDFKEESTFDPIPASPTPLP